MNSISTLQPGNLYNMYACMASSWWDFRNPKDILLLIIKSVSIINNTFEQICMCAIHQSIAILLKRTYFTMRVRRNAIPGKVDLARHCREKWLHMLTRGSVILSYLLIHISFQVHLPHSFDRSVCLWHHQQGSSVWNQFQSVHGCWYWYLAYMGWML